MNAGCRYVRCRGDLGLDFSARITYHHYIEHKKHNHVSGLNMKGTVDEW